VAYTIYFHSGNQTLRLYFLLVAVAIIPYSCAAIAFSIRDATSGEAAWAVWMRDMYVVEVQIFDYHVRRFV
jgi:hypothetical protein